MRITSNATLSFCGEFIRPSDSYGPSAVIVMSTATLIIFFTSIIANSVVFYIFYKCSSLLTTSNRFILNLTICNMLNALFVTPFIFVTVISQCWHFGDFWCYATGFLTTTIFASSTLTLFVISFDRYCAVVSPLHYKMRITKRRANLMTVSVWLVAFLCALPPLLGWNHYEYQWEKMSCTVFWRSDYMADKYYTLFLTLLCFVIPLVAIVWAYVAMYRAASQNSERTRRNSVLLHRPSYDDQGNEQTKYKPGLKVGAKRGSVVTELLFNRRLSSMSIRQGSLLWHRDEWKAAVTSLLVVSTFVICWLPYFIIIILETTVFDSTQIVPSVIQQISIFLALSNSALNPIVYVFRSKIVRRELKTMLLDRNHPLQELTILERSDETLDSVNDETVTPGNGKFGSFREKDTVVESFDDYTVDM